MLPQNITAINTLHPLQPGLSLDAGAYLLPAANFNYPIFVRCTSSSFKDAELLVALKKGAIEISRQLYPISAHSQTIDFYFEIDKSFDPVNIYIYNSGQASVFIQVPLNPILQQQSAIFPETDLPSSLAKHLSKRFEVKKTMLPPKVNEVAGNATDEACIRSFVVHEIFRGFLTQDAAEMQLDYVVYQKSFAPDGTKGFNKFKRRVYRKVFVSTYRLLTANPVRKRYFAKLYRNYVNTNALAENYTQLKDL